MKQNINRKVKLSIIILIIIILLITWFIISILNYFNLIPKKSYTASDFGIETIKSNIDYDNDGIDDYTDILLGARKDAQNMPKYKSAYYAEGYPNDGYGVCTDVVAFGLKDAGYDLRKLVYEDVLEYPDEYAIDLVDKNIDFRRVENLNIYLKRHALSLTTDIHKIMEWQGGDIVVFKGHIGVISDYRNARGVPFVLHHAHPYQRDYEEDILELEQKKIIGHYRIS